MEWTYTFMQTGLYGMNIHIYANRVIWNEHTHLCKQGYMEWTYTFMQTGLYGVNIHIYANRVIWSEHTHLCKQGYMEWTYTFMQTGLYGMNIHIYANRVIWSEHTHLCKQGKMKWTLTCREKYIMHYVFTTTGEGKCRIIHVINKSFLIASFLFLCYFKTALLKNNLQVVTTKITE